MHRRNLLARPSRLLIAAACAALLLALRPPATAAHPLGNFSVNLHSAIAVGGERIQIGYVVDMAEIPTFQEWGSTLPDANTQQSYLDRLAPVLRDGLQLDLDGTRTPLTLDGATIAFPAGQGGLPTTRIELALWAAVPDAAQHAITYRDGNFTDRLGWREIVIDAAPGTALREATAASRSISDELRAYPDGLLSSPLDVRSASASFAPGAGGNAQSAPAVAAPAGDRLAALVDVDTRQPGALAGALLAALLLGAAHALSPGHGKTIVAAYLVGSRGTPRHAMFLGLVTTATHTAGVWALGLVTLYASHALVPERIYPWLGVLSGGMVVLVGASLLRSRLRLARGLAPLHAHDHAHDDGMIHTHQHPHSHPPHGAGGTRVTWRSLASLAVSGGLVPCPTALVLMLGAIGVGRVGLGLALVTVFSAGLALVLTGVGLVFLYGGKRLGRLGTARFPLAGAAVRMLPLAGSVVVVVAGALITLRAALALN